MPSGYCLSIPRRCATTEYDIADYTSVHPSYGTLQDFKDFWLPHTIGVFA